MKQAHKTSKPRILFMGTPDFAVPSLDRLLQRGYPLIGVVTQPDRPKGRGKQMARPPVRVFAEAKSLPVFQPERIRDLEFIKLFGQLAPDLVVVAAFGQILPREILEQPRLGCINVHPSLLPKYRGAAPLNWTIIRGETRTGVTIMQMDEGMDSGDILLQEGTDLNPLDTVGELHDRLARMGANLLVKTIEMIETNAIRRIPQDPAAVTFAPRLSKEGGLIRWDLETHDIIRRIRGLSPSPGAYSFWDGKTLKIFQGACISNLATALPGTVRTSGQELLVAAGNGWVSLLDLQLEGKKRMPVQDFLRGCRLQNGVRLG